MFQVLIKSQDNKQTKQTHMHLNSICDHYKEKKRKVFQFAALKSVQRIRSNLTADAEFWDGPSGKNLNQKENMVIVGFSFF